MVRGEVCWLVLRWVSSVLSFRGRLVGLSWPAVDVAHGGGFRGSRFVENWVGLHSLFL